MQEKLAITTVSIHEIISKRWSPRAFDASRAVADGDLYALLEAARWAPSCFNEQPWRYIVCVKSKEGERWQAALDSLAEKNQLWAINAPVLIVAVAMNNFNHNGNPNPWATYDTGAANVSLSLQAAALGLVVHQMGGFSSDQIRTAFALPEDCTPLSVLAVGYQADADILDDDFKAMERRVRSRVPLTEIVYSGCWGLEIKM
ncbi:MAG TPA: nitroreductase [Gammaproteobacteria bacterium]|nr:nitroreductase [Gammaproteobacteria bacterium]